MLCIPDMMLTSLVVTVRNSSKIALVGRKLATK